MKKVIALTHPKVKVPRLVEAAKYEAKKYLKRERNKKRPEGADYWDFDCKYGATELEAETIHVSGISEHIDQAEQKGLESFYLEILAKPGIRNKQSTSTANSHDQASNQNPEEN